MPAIDVNGKRIHYEEAGGGRPVVLIHGFPLDGRIFENQLSGLSDRWRVIVPDLPGFGRSPPAGDFTMASLAGDVHAFLSAIGALPCVLGGLSMGGYVALPMFFAHPEDFRGLMLIDTRAEADTPEAKSARQQMIERVKAGGTSAVAEQMFPRMMAQSSVHADAGLSVRLMKIMNDQPAGTVERALVAIRDRESFQDRLGEVSVPTLVMVGEFDVITPPDLAERMHKSIPVSFVSEIPGAGHLPTMEQPAEVNRVIGKFLSELSW